MVNIWQFVKDFIFSTRKGRSNSWYQSESQVPAKRSREIEASRNSKDHPNIIKPTTK